MGLINNDLFFRIDLGLRKFKYFFVNQLWSDKTLLRRQFRKYQGYALDLDNPKTLNEKLQWIKLHDRRPFQQVLADKIGVRNYIEKHLGSDLLVPLLFRTTDYRQLVPENLPDIPFIIKLNHDSGSFVIVRDKSTVDWEAVRRKFRFGMAWNYYWSEREWQYKGIVPEILVEELLVCSDGSIPNDYKINCVGGEVGFVYVAVDREGKNKRNIYDAQWNPLSFTWGKYYKDHVNFRGEEVDAPSTLGRMLEISKRVAQLFPYVRVDFYDVDGRLYLGEITQCQGGGYDQFLPFSWDLYWGEKMPLSMIERDYEI